MYGQPGFADGSEIETVARFDELALVGTERFAQAFAAPSVRAANRNASAALARMG
jgi:hypothetical protein